jgi:hypothetical protein
MPHRMHSASYFPIRSLGKLCQHPLDLVLIRTPTTISVIRSVSSSLDVSIPQIMWSLNSSRLFELSKPPSQLGNVGVGLYLREDTMEVLA